MGDVKCTFGTRAHIDIDMLNEIIYREVKHFRNYKRYRPNFGAIPLTGKFYARQDRLASETKEEVARIDKYHKKVTAARVQGPRFKYPAPATCNQIYGWYNKPVMPIDRNDRRFYMPRRETPQMKIDLTIMMCNLHHAEHTTKAK